MTLIVANQAISQIIPYFEWDSDCLKVLRYLGEKLLNSNKQTDCRGFSF
ncbi:hypothetical protein PATA110615_30725 [Paenibacillus taichungensis]